jgi:glutaryl-CoA dehydrogenase
VLDYCEFESLLTEDERILSRQIRRWVDERVLPQVGDWFSKAEFPRHLVPEMAELGLFGVELPAEYGCTGGSAVDYGIAMMELERGDSGIRSCASVQGSLVMYPIFAYGSEGQRRKYLPELAKGKLIGCFGLTEPDHGSDPGHMKTRAVRDGNGWVLNGAKMWITNSPIADVAVVWAQTGAHGDPKGVRGFVVEAGTPGYSAPETHNKMSLRASYTGEIVLDDVRVPESAMLPNVAGLKGPLGCLTQARYGIAWGAIGVMQACYEAALSYARERTQFGKPIAGFQLTQEKLAEMVTEISKAQFLTLQVGRIKDKERLRNQQVSLIKRNNVYQALQMARTARTILGANGITTEYTPIRHALNMESVITYEGTHEIHTLILGADVTGIPAFS